MPFCEWVLSNADVVPDAEGQADVLAYVPAHLTSIVSEHPVPYPNYGTTTPFSVPELVHSQRNKDVTQELRVQRSNQPASPAASATSSDGGFAWKDKAYWKWFTASGEDNPTATMDEASAHYDTINNPPRYPTKPCKYKNMDEC